MSETAKQPADFKITSDGTWFHEGAPIKREALAKLFSDRALKIDEEGNYWLQTPFEKYPVEVEDVPYVAVDFEIQDGSVTFRTNMEEKVTLAANTEWELRNNIPYFEVRNGLYAKLGRSVYYNLVEQYGASLMSDGAKFSLGELDG